MKWLRHAFALDPETFEPDEADRRLIARLAEGVVRRRLTAPALITLECGRNLGFLAGQTLVFFQPLLSVLFRADEISRVVALLERRGSIEYVCRAIEDAAGQDGHVESGSASEAAGPNQGRPSDPS